MDSRSASACTANVSTPLAPDNAEVHLAIRSVTMSGMATTWMPYRTSVFAVTAASLACALTTGLRAGSGGAQAGATERRERIASAVVFLAREVPRWHAEQGCYSCHNNGDAVRALIAASASGFDVAEPLSDTVAFLARPSQWADNSRGGPLDDQPLARVQFANALTDAVARDMASPEALIEAARLVAADQHEDGSWHLDPSNSLGSPATYGRALATWSARRTLVASGSPDFQEQIGRADRWLRGLSFKVTPDAAAVLLGLGHADDARAIEQRERAVTFLVDTQGSDGGWGPYPNVRPEPFDTAIAVLALRSQPTTDAITRAIDSGREYLLNSMLDGGMWLETTRPPGQRSYAQLISTTGWALIALLE